MHKAAAAAASEYAASVVAAKVVKRVCVHFSIKLNIINRFSN